MAAEAERAKVARCRSLLSGVVAGRHQRVSKSGPPGGGGRGADGDCTADDCALGCGVFAAGWRLPAGTGTMTSSV